MFSVETQVEMLRAINASGAHDCSSSAYFNPDDLEKQEAKLRKKNENDGKGKFIKVDGRSNSWYFCVRTLCSLGYWSNAYSSSYSVADTHVADGEYQA